VIKPVSTIEILNICFSRSLAITIWVLYQSGFCEYHTHSQNLKLITTSPSKKVDLNYIRKLLKTNDTKNWDCWLPVSNLRVHWELLSWKQSSCNCPLTALRWIPRTVRAHFLGNGAFVLVPLAPVTFPEIWVVITRNLVNICWEFQCASVTTWSLSMNG